MRSFYIEKTRYDILNVSSGAFLFDLQGHVHGNACYELHFLYAGSGALTADGSTYALQKGSVFVTGPGVWHSQATHRDNPMAEHCILLHIQESRDALSAAFAENKFWLGRGSARLQRLFQAVCTADEANTALSDEKAATYAKLIVLELIERYTGGHVGDSPAQSVPDDRRLLIIENAFLSACDTLTLHTLAEQLNMSVRQTQRLLQKYYNTTFIQKRTQARMEKATLLIAEGARMEEIGNALGYCDAAAFAHAFGQYYHMSFSRYKAQLQKMPKKK